MFMILVARCLERIGDNTVDIAEQVVFVVTGLFREMADTATSADAAAPGETTVTVARPDGGALAARRAIRRVFALATGPKTTSVAAPDNCAHAPALAPDRGVRRRWLLDGVGQPAAR